MYPVVLRGEIRDRTLAPRGVRVRFVVRLAPYNAHEVLRRICGGIADYNLRRVRVKRADASEDDVGRGIKVREEYKLRGREKKQSVNGKICPTERADW